MTGVSEDRFDSASDSFSPGDSARMMAAKTARTTNTPFQPHWSAVTPPITGADAGAMPLMAPIRAMSLARGRPEYTSAGMVRARKYPPDAPIP